jgi:hypothetical protein
MRTYGFITTSIGLADLGSTNLMNSFLKASNSTHMLICMN